MEFGKGFFVALFAILLSLTVVFGPGAGASSAMDCSTAAFQALPLFDEQFGKPVMGLTATPVAADAEAPAYCDVRGTMWPEIKFQVVLPSTTWNGKFYMAGGGGFDGRIPAPAEARMPARDCAFVAASVGFFVALRVWT